MPESVGIAKQNEPASKVSKVKRIPIGNATSAATSPVTRSATITLAKKKKIATDNSPLEWYRLTEITMHVLNAAIIKNDKEQMSESSKAKPDLEKINQLKLKNRKVLATINDGKNFESISRMQQLLEEYSK